MNFCWNSSASLSLVGVCLVLSGCGTPAGPATPQMAMPTRVAAADMAPRTLLVPGDTLEVFVKEDNKFDGQYKVRENGDIIVKQIGRLKVGGLTVSGAQEALRQNLESSQLAHPTVIMDRVGTITSQTFEEKAKLLIYVTGAVKTPGQHMIAVTNNQPILAYEALLIAGGTTAFADESHAFILRRGAGTMRSTIPLNLRSIRQGIGPDVPLQEGDLITVPERRFGLNF